MVSKTKKSAFFLIILLITFLLSFPLKEPFYGKLNFILLDTFSIYYMIASEISSRVVNYRDTDLFISDYVTEYSIYSAFHAQTIGSRTRYLETYSNVTFAVSSLTSESNVTCLINLKGFPDTWVPRLTGHWDPIISNTARFYEHNGYRGKKLAITIENQFKDKCILLNDKELPWDEDENFRYRSPNLNYTGQQEDIHILQFKEDTLGNKYNILIDAGMVPQVADKLLDYLAINEIYQIDEIFITHPHKDHYSGLYELIQFGIPIKKVWMNLPLKENCDREIPWGCDFADLQKLISLMKEKGIEHKEISHTNPKEPISLYQDKYNKLEMLFANPGAYPQVSLDINDLSIIMKLKTNGVSYLFTGDLNQSLSDYLKSNPSFKADIFKVPHHGTEGVASNEFFDTVGAKIGIVPSPQNLWCSDRSSRIRNYFRFKKTQLYVSGFHGDILFRHFENGEYKVSVEYDPPRMCGEKMQQSYKNKVFKVLNYFE